MFGNLDPAKMLVILVFALVVIGPDKLPKLARQLGTAWHQLTQVRSQVVDEMRSAMPDLEQLPKIPHLKPGVVSSFLNDLTGPTSAPRAAKVAAAAGAAAILGGSASSEATASGRAVALDGAAPDSASTPTSPLARIGSMQGGALSEGTIPDWDPYSSSPDDPSMN